MVVVWLPVKWRSWFAGRMWMELRRESDQLGGASSYALIDLASLRDEKLANGLGSWDS